MPVFIFNSKKEFWDDTARCFRTEPKAIASITEATMEIRMAGRRDNTSDMLSFECGEEDKALAHIESIEFSGDRLEILKDMNSCLR